MFHATITSRALLRTKIWAGTALFSHSVFSRPF